MQEIEKQRMKPYETPIPESPYKNRSSKDPEIPIHAESSVTFGKSLHFKKVFSGPGEDLETIPLPPGARVIRRPKIPPVHTLLKAIGEGDTSDQVLVALQQHYQSGGRSEKRLIWLRLRMMDREDLYQTIKGVERTPLYKEPVPVSATFEGEKL